MLSVPAKKFHNIGSRIRKQEEEEEAKRNAVEQQRYDLPPEVTNQSPTRPRETSLFEGDMEPYTRPSQKLPNEFKCINSKLLDQGGPTSTITSFYLSAPWRDCGKI